MHLKMFAIRDEKAETFHPPYFQPTHGEGERYFKDLCRESKSPLSQYPEDFDLWYLGDYETNTGKFSPLQTPQHLMKAVQCVKQKLDSKSDNVLPF